MKNVLHIMKMEFFFSKTVVSQRLIENETVVASILGRIIILFIYHFYFFVMVTRQSAALSSAALLNTQCLDWLVYDAECLKPRFSIPINVNHFVVK